MHLFLPASAYFSLPLFSLYLSPLLSTSAPSSFSASTSSFPSQSLCLCLGFCISDCNFLFLSLSLSEVLSVLLFFSSCFFFFLHSFSAYFFLFKFSFGGYPTPSACVLSLSISASPWASPPMPGSLSPRFSFCVSISVFVSDSSSFSSFLFSLFSSSHAHCRALFLSFPDSLGFLMFPSLIPCVLPGLTDSPLLENTHTHTHTHHAFPSCILTWQPSPLYREQAVNLKGLHNTTGSCLVYGASTKSQTHISS